ncbi:MAG: CARDB domain-containing protein [Planctomycetota bacterium]|nr:CARDB domain-containing protein [Planctomycetota bacterium]
MKITVLQIDQLDQLDDVRLRADLALSARDTRLDLDGTLTTRIHNIGSKSAQSIEVVLLRKNKVVSTRTLSKIEAPLDLYPKFTSLQFRDARPGDTVAIDPKNEIPEIAEHNNLVKVRKP